MIKSKVAEIQKYFSKVKAANKEAIKKEAFKDLLNRLYKDDNEILAIVDAITRGAEKTVLNIPRKDKLHKGSADTLYNKVIIEFENSLKVSLDHAKVQLAGYLLGQYKSGHGYNYTLIVSDFINWRVVVPEVSQLDKLHELTEDELQLDDIPSASIVLTENNAEDFYYWIDRFLFKEEKQKATLKVIEDSFGYRSNVFIDSYLIMSKWFEEAKKYGEVQVSYEQWEKFLSIAYGSFDASEKIFLIHTYLSVFSKMLAYAIVSNDDYIDDKELVAILDGSIFDKYNINNFVDNDFFHWVTSDLNFKKLKMSFRRIAQEISTFDFHNVDEDVLKGVYQELIDLDTRHALGEYYTPDWLCERVVYEFEFKKGQLVLDPACGSGSFLRAAIHRFKQVNSDITAEEINSSIYGIDIHPLSVQIAKTTVLISLGKEIRMAKRPVHINIILANTLLAPEGVKTLFGGVFRMDIDSEKLDINTKVLEDVALFDNALEICDELAEQTKNKKKETLNSFQNILRSHYKSGGITPAISDSFYDIYLSLKIVKENNRDSIWKFIVQNLYKPYFLSEKFDFVIGNPPWFTFNSVRNISYQETLNKLADKYNIKTNQKGTFAHLEIAAIFLAHCSNYFLKKTGKIAFVLPRSFFNGAQHDNIRNGKAKGFKLTSIWDLNSVVPLFRIPSAVLFAQNAEFNKALPTEGINGKLLTGKLPDHNCNWELAKTKIVEENTTWFYIRQGKSSAFSNNKLSSTRKTSINYYKKEFKAGATLRPRAFSFIELDQDMPPDFKDRVINIKTSDAIKEESKKPWQGLEFSGRMESQFLFLTAISRSILPFHLYHPEYIVLPILVSASGNNKSIELCEYSDLRHSGYLNASRWFENIERIWRIHRTSKNEQYTASEYLNFQNKIVSQNLNLPYLVLYN